MTKRQFIFWAIIAVIVAGLVTFVKFNPVFATLEVIAAFFIGVFGETAARWVYDKWIK